MLYMYLGFPSLSAGNSCSVGHLDLILGWEDPLEEDMAPTPAFLPGEFPWTEVPGGLQSMRWQRVGHD